MIAASYIKAGAPCIFHKATGLYCPGCGGTRALLALLSGHPVLSFLYHPLVDYLAAVLLWYLIRWSIYGIALKAAPQKSGALRPGFSIAVVVIASVIIIANVLIRDLALILFGINLMP